MWHRMDARLANRAWHWMFLALPAPFPETMIGKDALYFFDTRAAAGTKIKSLSAFDARALAHYLGRRRRHPGRDRCSARDLA
jgi:haloacetate dehalogenase